MKKYDIVIIGSGAAGFPAAEAASRAGKTACMIEAGELGGECPNWACIPTKALLKAVRMYTLAKSDLSEFGVNVSNISYDFKKMMQYRHHVVDTITDGGKRTEALLKKLGVDLVRGFAVFKDDHTVIVNEEEIEGKVIVIATGATDFVPPIAGIQEIGYWNYQDAVTAEEQPKSLAIIGAGPVGCEFTTIYSGIGTKVTLIDHGDHILGREEPEIAQIVHDAFTEKGVDIVNKGAVLSVQHDRGKILLTYQKEGSESEDIYVDKIMLAAGKRANIHKMGLDRTGVQVDERGRLILSESLQTTVPHIFAAGDVTSNMMFTHTAHHEGAIVAENVLELLSGGNDMQKRDLGIVPRVTFTHPEVASVGMTLQEAKKKGGVMMGQFEMASLGRSVTEAVRTGLVQIITDEKGLILGGHIAGPHAGEMIHEIAIAMKAKMKAEDLGNTIHAFPTFSEAIVAAAAMVQQI